MLCKILKPFPFSRDGINAEHAKPSDQINIPDNLVPGLLKERYVTVLDEEGAKSLSGSPENKADDVPENKTDMRKLRADYERVVGKPPWMGWDENELRKRMAEAEAEQVQQTPNTEPNLQTVPEQQPVQPTPANNPTPVEPNA
ncbi:MAG: hypothetical protein MI753_09370 [Hyphomicrobiales bacterium]|nr:hypothetical protein [Hyphomicrobiales bacterium]